MPVTANYGNLRTTSAYHYALSHNWDLRITQFPEQLMGLVPAFGNEAGIINTSCTQVSNLPSSNLNEGIISGNVRGIPFHQPGGRESSVREINLSLNEWYDYRVFRFFESWKSMAVNRFDFSQNLNAMIPGGVHIILTDSDRQNVVMTYNLYDVCCTKCNLGGELSSEPDIMKVQISLKCGFFDIFAGAGGMDKARTSGAYTWTDL